MTIEEFVDKSEYFDSFEYRMNWNGYTVYYVWAKADEGACTGYPRFALETAGTIRKANHEEVIKIMHSLPNTDKE